MGLIDFAEAVVGPLRPWQRRILGAMVERDPWRDFRPRPPELIRAHLRPEDLNR